MSLISIWEKNQDKCAVIFVLLRLPVKAQSWFYSRGRESCAALSRWQQNCCFRAALPEAGHAEPTPPPHPRAHRPHSISTPFFYNYNANKSLYYQIPSGCKLLNKSYRYHLFQWTYQVSTIGQNLFNVFSSEPQSHIFSLASA